MKKILSVQSDVYDYMKRDIKSVVVTGATGFIGSWLVEELLKNNIHVTVIVKNKIRLITSISESELVDIIESDLTKPLQFKRRENYDAFFHLAWGALVPKKRIIS